MTMALLIRWLTLTMPIVFMVILIYFNTYMFVYQRSIMEDYWLQILMGQRFPQPETWGFAEIEVEKERNWKVFVGPWCYGCRARATRMLWEMVSWAPKSQTCLATKTPASLDVLLCSSPVMTSDYQAWLRRSAWMLRISFIQWGEHLRILQLLVWTRRQRIWHIVYQCSRIITIVVQDKSYFAGLYVFIYTYTYTCTHTYIYIYT